MIIEIPVFDETLHFSQILYIGPILVFLAGNKGIQTYSSVKMCFGYQRNLSVCGRWGSFQHFQQRCKAIPVFSHQHLQLQIPTYVDLGST